MLTLKQFLNKNPEYNLSDISKLKRTITIGEYASDFCYVIGGLLIMNIHKKGGVKGVLDVLQYGISDDDFHQLIEDKLGVTKDNFEAYIKKELKNYT
jgi:hypothetical protein